MGTPLNTGATGTTTTSIVYDKSYVPGSKTDVDTAETTLYTKTLKAVDISAKTVLRITARSYSADASVLKTFRLRLGGTQLAILAHTATNDLISIVQVEFRNSKAAQVSRYYGFGQSSAQLAGKTDTTVDCTVNQDITITYAWGTAGTGSKSVALESVIIELFQ